VSLSAESLDLIRHGPLVEVTVKLHPSSRPDLKDLKLWGEAPSFTLPFLVDTGARNTLVDQQLIDTFKIEPITYNSIETASDVLPDCPAYLVELHIELRDGRVVLPTTVVALPAGRLLRPSGPRFRGVLGRSSLQKARFMYDGAVGAFEILRAQK
jgi:hypothetical protein